MPFKRQPLIQPTAMSSQVTSADDLRTHSILANAVDRMSESLYLCDEKARLLHVNTSACASLGYSREELLRLCLFDIDPEFPQERWDAHWHNVIGGHAIPPIKTRHRTKSGQVFPVEMVSSHFPFDGAHYILALVRDITERAHTEDELRRREQQFRTLAENSPDMIVRFARGCRRSYVNPAFARMTGQATNDLIGKTPFDYKPSHDAMLYEQAVAAVFENGERRDLEYIIPSQEGQMRICDIRLTPEFDPTGRVESVLAIGRDISTLKEAQQRLEQAEAMAHLGHWQWDHACGEAVLSAEMCRILDQSVGWKPTLKDAMKMVVAEDRRRIRNTLRGISLRRETNATFSYRMRCGDRLRYLHAHVHIEYGLDDSPQRIIGTTQDVTELKHYESRLHEVSFHDALTGLPNRVLLLDRLGQALVEPVRPNQVLGLLVLDLDRFKEINDTHGHKVGDDLLREAARRLRELFRSYDTVARLSGDEFAIVLPSVREAADLGKISQKMLDALSRPFRSESQDLYISASVGICVFPTDGVSAAELLQHADSALNEAKARGRACFRYYSADLTARSKERATLEADLRRARANGELELYFQPKVALSDGRLVGAEALLRWRHPTQGLLSPDRFIGIAEDIGLIVGIGRWVLTNACQAARRCNTGGGVPLKIAVNLSSRQFSNDNLVDTVSQCLAATRCDPRWLELEITESLLLDDDDGTRATLNALREMGISIAIDDFGTGYSSLAYLKRFPIDVLKIDRSFVRDVPLDRDSTELVKAIITIAHSLRLEVVAEGIENQVQRQFLQEHSCQFGQGYHFGIPMPLDEFEALPMTTLHKAIKWPGTAAGWVSSNPPPGFAS